LEIFFTAVVRLCGVSSLIHNVTLNLNISASRLDIKILVGNFGAIYVRLMHTNIQASSSTGMGGGGGDRWTDMGSHPIFPRAMMKFLTPASLRLLCSGRIKFIWLRSQDQD